jgi:hypothetical protein
MKKRLLVVAALLIVALGGPVAAGEVKIVIVKFVLTSDVSRDVHTTLQRIDTGWGHYADAWRILNTGGAELARRSLAHPHVAEQPFTRSLGEYPSPRQVPK